jgi:hypothetical protein
MDLRSGWTFGHEGARDLDLRSAAAPGPTVIVLRGSSAPSRALPAIGRRGVRA